ncbi:methylated-DNA--[protein]-cysteine S-methyltransferase, partial [Limnofasciculus baicalensis]
SFILHPSSFILHPSSFILHPFDIIIDGLSVGENNRMRINFTIVDSSLGSLVVGATQQGICAVNLGDYDSVIKTGFLAQYPGVTVHLDDTGIRKWVDRINNYINGEEFALNLPLDVRGTDFQRQVWQALQTIPYGMTSTYSEIAEIIGYPKAARAVGNACGANPVALIIPCHRVVGKNNNLGGYRWGREWKKTLLAMEQAAIAS